MIRALDTLTRNKLMMFALTLAVAFATATLASSASAAPMKGKSEMSYARPTPSWQPTQPMPIEKGKPSSVTVTDEPSYDGPGEEVAPACDTMSQSNSRGRSGGFSSYTARGFSIVFSMLPGGGFILDWMEWTSSNGSWWENEYDSSSHNCNNGDMAKG